jgi:hypothetical protein
LREGVIHKIRRQAIGNERESRKKHLRKGVDGGKQEARKRENEIK